MKNQKLLIYGGLALVAALVIYMFWPQISSLFSKNDSGSSSGSAPKKTGTKTGGGKSGSSSTSTTTSSTAPPKPARVKKKWQDIKVGSPIWAVKDTYIYSTPGLGSRIGEYVYHPGMYIGVVSSKSGGALQIHSIGAASSGAPIDFWVLAQDYEVENK